MWFSLPLSSVALSLLGQSSCHHNLKTLWYVTITLWCFVTFIRYTSHTKYMSIARSNVWEIFKSDLLSQKLSKLKTWPLSDVVKSLTFSYKHIYVVAPLYTQKNKNFSSFSTYEHICLIFSDQTVKLIWLLLTSPEDTTFHLISRNSLLDHICVFLILTDAEDKYVNF